MPQLIQFLQQNAALIVLFLVIAFALWIARLTVAGTAFPYERRTLLLNEQELKFAKALQAAIGGSWLLLPKMPLSVFIQVRPETAGAATWHAKLNQNMADFAICNHDDFRVLLVVEFVQQAATPHEPKFNEHVLRVAGIPLLQVEKADNYDKVELRKVLDDILQNKKKK
jgi:Protein of unknown function (DUF2726)